jgi:anti-anti-sigma factor
LAPDWAIQPGRLPHHAVGHRRCPTDGSVPDEASRAVGVRDPEGDDPGRRDAFSLAEEFCKMTGYRRLDVHEVGDVTVVRFRDRKIIDDINIQELGQELFRLIEQDNRQKLLLNFSSVDFLSSAALGKLITLEKKVKAHEGAMKLSNIRPEIYEVFAITKLNRLFDIQDDEADALAAF